jgi:hypothetical protein
MCSFLWTLYILPSWHKANLSQISVGNVLQITAQKWKVFRTRVGASFTKCLWNLHSANILNRLLHHYKDCKDQKEGEGYHSGYAVRSYFFNL